MFIWFPNLPLGDISLSIQFEHIPRINCHLGVKHVYTVSKPTSSRLSAKGAASLYCFWTYVQGTVGQGCSFFIQFPNLPPAVFSQMCSQFIQFLNLPPGYYLSRVQPVYTVFPFTLRKLSTRGKVCINNFSTYLQGTVGKGCKLVLRFLNLTSVDCRPGVQTVYIVSIPSSGKL